jgi:hypothetical protein
MANKWQKEITAVEAYQKKRDEISFTTIEEMHDIYEFHKGAQSGNDDFSYERSICRLALSYEKLQLDLSRLLVMNSDEPLHKKLQELLIKTGFIPTIVAQ